MPVATTAGVEFTAPDMPPGMPEDMLRLCDVCGQPIEDGQRYRIVVNIADGSYAPDALGGMNFPDHAPQPCMDFGEPRDVPCQRTVLSRLRCRMYTWLGTRGLIGR